jgi:uncharacterized protein (TIGR00730 family)
MTKNFIPAPHIPEQIPEIMAELQAAADQMVDLGPAVSLFGSARIARESPYYAQSLAIAEGLARAGFAVISGGGPGIMEAASKGAFEAGGESVGLNIKLPHETTDNSYQTRSLHFHHFSPRKAVFFMYSVGYVVLPGGFGTLDELFEALTLIQTRKLPPAPIILVGSAFWSSLVDWIREHLLAEGTIGPGDLKLFTVEDDPDRVVEQLLAFHRKHPLSALRPPALVPAK